MQLNHQLTRMNTNEQGRLVSAVDAHLSVTSIESRQNPSPPHAIGVNSCPLVVAAAAVRRLRGFTLIELVLVMAMLMIVLAVSFPSLRNFFRGRNLDSEARRFLALTRYAQSRAVSEGVPMALWVDAPQGTYGLQAQTSYLQEDDKAQVFTVDETLQLELVMPTLVRTATHRSGTLAARANLPTIQFTPDGFISDTSPERVVIRQGNDDAVAIGQSAARLNYEIQAANEPVAPPPLRRTGPQR